MCARVYVRVYVCVCVRVCVHVCTSVSPDLGQPRTGIGAVLRRGAPSSCLHPHQLWSLSGACVVNKNQNSTPIWESDWGLRALNQGKSCLPFPRSLMLLVPPQSSPPSTRVGPASLAQGEPQGLGDRAREGQVPLPFVKTSLPELASLLPAPDRHLHQPGETYA